MPYTLPEVPADPPKTFTAYQNVVRALSEAQHDRSWVAVCYLLHDGIDAAKDAAKQADEAFAAKAAYQRANADRLDDLIDREFGPTA